MVIPGQAAGPVPVAAIGRRAAQRLARAELAKPEYHRAVSLPLRVLRAVMGWLGRIYHAAGTIPGGWWGLVSLAVLAVILVATILAWTGPVARSRRAPRLLSDGGAGRTARDHRRDAQQLAAAGDYAAAIQECVRAIAAELQERGILPPAAGRTADEFAEEAGRALPAEAPALRAAARLFDEVCYGARGGSAQAYEQLRGLDLRVSAAVAGSRRALVAAPAGRGRTLPW